MGIPSRNFDILGTKNGLFFVTWTTTRASWSVPSTATPATTSNANSLLDCLEIASKAARLVAKVSCGCREICQSDISREIDFSTNQSYVCGHAVAGIRIEVEFSLGICHSSRGDGLIAGLTSFIFGTSTDKAPTVPAAATTLVSVLSEKIPSVSPAEPH